jgi:hypothetical protein
MFSLIWVTDLGYAGMEDQKFATADAAKAAATNGVTWTRRGQEWQSTRSQYGDIFFVKPVR